ncbi:hypothetical protein QJQ45_020930 [Haematococcus lacustris]|nr:hypothetical protein QJQ45_020930 [Haematococcus lacustris]
MGTAAVVLNLSAQPYQHIKGPLLLAATGGAETPNPSHATRVAAQAGSTRKLQEQKRREKRAAAELSITMEFASTDTRQRYKAATVEQQLAAKEQASNRARMAKQQIQAIAKYRSTIQPLPEKTKLTKGQVKQASGLNNARRTTQRWLAPIKPHLQHLAAASSAGTSLVANPKHITVTLATWDAGGGVPGPQLEEDMAEASMKRHGHAKQLVVFFGTASIGTRGGWGADAVLCACCKVGKAAKAKPAPQPGRWLDRDCNAALNMQRIRESRWRPLELCYWPEQGALPAKGKEYPGLGYKQLQDKPPKAQQQPAEAQYCVPPH